MKRKNPAKNNSPLLCRLFGHKPPGYGYYGSAHIAPRSGPGVRVSISAICGRDGCTTITPMCQLRLPTEQQMEDGHNVPGSAERASLRRQGKDPWAQESTPVQDTDLNYTGWP